jgi:hypothetical protein
VSRTPAWEWLAVAAIVAGILALTGLWMTSPGPQQGWRDTRDPAQMLEWPR